MERQKIYAELNQLFEEPRLQKLYRVVESAFKEKDAIGHNWEHVRRDIVNIIEVGLEEGADMEIVMPAIILHDIGLVTHPHEPKKHPIHGARECYRFLDDWTPEQRERISSCILKHKAKYPGYEHTEPETLEERVVCDADQVDKFGWVGFMQSLKVYVEYGTKGNERFKTLAGLAEALTHHDSITLYTETGKRLAAQLSDPDFNEVSMKLIKELSLSEDWKEPF